MKYNKVQYYLGILSWNLHKFYVSYVVGEKHGSNQVGVCDDSKTHVKDKNVTQNTPHE
jgi:hypothetical protein